MSPVTRRSKALPLIVLVTGIVVSLSGCIMPPALPTAPPQVPSASPQPTATADTTREYSRIRLQPMIQASISPSAA